MVEVVQKVAEGNYGDEIMELTRNEVPEPVRTVAEAMGLMMVKVEAREFVWKGFWMSSRSSTGRSNKHHRGALLLSQALHERDQYTQGHASRVSEYAEKTARHLGSMKRKWSTCAWADCCTI